MIVRLTKKQLKYKEDFVKRQGELKLSSADTSAFCFNADCGCPGDARDPHSMFDAVIPPVDPRDISKGLKLDEIKMIWFCSGCTARLMEIVKNMEENGF